MLNHSLNFDEKTSEVDLASKDLWAVIFYSFMLLSGFSIDLFSFSMSYFYEIPVFISLLYSLIWPNEVSNTFIGAMKQEKNNIVIALIFLFLIFTLGFIVTLDFTAVYSDFRSNCVALFGFFYIKKLLEDKKYLLLYSLSMAVGLLFLLQWFYLLKNGTLEVKFPTPMVAIVIACILAIRIGSIPKLASSMSLLIFLAVVSFYRQYWFYVIATVMIFFISSPNGDNKNKSKIIWVGVIIFVLVFFGYELVSNLFNSNESFYIQSIGKSNDLLDFYYGSAGLSESDAIRVGYFEYLLNNFFGLFFPHGLGSRYYFDNIDPWFRQFSIEANSIDSLAFYIIFHYGYITLILLLLFTLKDLIKDSSGSFISWLVLFFPIVLLLLFDGGAATVIPRSFWVGGYFAFFIVERNMYIKNNFFKRI